MEKDEDLYYRIRQGDLKAFDILYERYQSSLFRFIYSYLKNREESEEVFHEVFIQVLSTPNLVAFDQGTLKGWVYRVARNLCLNRLRSKKRGEAALSQIETQVTAQTGRNAIQDSSESEFLKKDFAEQVISAAEKLPEPMLALFNMRRMGMAYQEISQALGVPLGTVKSRIHTLVEALKAGLR